MKPTVHTTGRNQWLERTGYQNHCRVDGPILSELPLEKPSFLARLFGAK